MYTEWLAFRQKLIELAEENGKVVVFCETREERKAIAFALSASHLERVGDSIAVLVMPNGNGGIKTDGWDYISNFNDSTYDDIFRRWKVFPEINASDVLSYTTSVKFSDSEFEALLGM